MWSSSSSWSVLSETLFIYVLSRPQILFAPTYAGTHHPGHCHHWHQLFGWVCWVAFKDQPFTRVLYHHRLSWNSQHCCRQSSFCLLCVKRSFRYTYNQRDRATGQWLVAEYTAEGHCCNALTWAEKCIFQLSDCLSLQLDWLHVMHHRYTFTGETRTLYSLDYFSNMIFRQNENTLYLHIKLIFFFF